jgi:hypothetical protein
MISKSLQSFFGHGIYREANCQNFDVQDVGCSRVFGAGAGPKQALGSGPEVVNTPRALGTDVRVIGRVDACAIATPNRLRSASGTLPITATSQRLLKTDATEGTFGLRPASIRLSNPPQVRFGCGEILLA